jgi:hypothetical protein
MDTSMRVAPLSGNPGLIKHFSLKGALVPLHHTANILSIDGVSGGGIEYVHHDFGLKSHVHSSSVDDNLSNLRCRGDADDGIVVFADLQFQKILGHGVSKGGVACLDDGLGAMGKDAKRKEEGG